MTEDAKRRLASVWFADIVGYTALSARDEAAALGLVRALQEIAAEEVARCGGRVVKHVGDAVLAVFESAGGGVEAALRLRDEFHACPDAVATGTRLRIGVHVGEIAEAEDGDVYGDGVNAASRIQGFARPGQVLLSEFAAEGVRAKADFRLVPKGERSAKGLSRPLALYAVGWADADDLFIGLDLEDEAANQAPRTRFGRAIAVGLLAGMAGMVGLGILAGAGPFFAVTPSGGGAPDGTPVASVPGGADDESVGSADVALGLGIEAYYRGDMDAATGALSRFLEPAGSPEQRRKGLRYLARTHIMVGDTGSAAAAVSQLITVEPPMALVLPSLEDPLLTDLYLEARRTRDLSVGRAEASAPMRELMLFDFQVFVRDLDEEWAGVEDQAGHLVAFMLETELMGAMVPMTPVKEMSFNDRGDQAYADLERTLLAMADDAPSHLLTGSVAINATGALLSAWVYEMETGRLVLSEQLSGPHADLLSRLPEELASRISDRLSLLPSA